jgi:hypothetical protein
VLRARGSQPLVHRGVRGLLRAGLRVRIPSGRMAFRRAKPGVDSRVRRDTRRSCVRMYRNGGRGSTAGPWIHASRVIGSPAESWTRAAGPERGPGRIEASPIPTGTLP